jgi:tetratricopeptide (TPR) repeat protein
MAFLFKDVKASQMRQSVQQTLLSAKKHAKIGDVAAAKQLYLAILAKFPKNKPAQLGLASLGKVQQTTLAQPSQQEMAAVIAIYRQGRLKDVVQHANALLARFPNTLMLHILLGEVHARLVQFQTSITHSSRALEIDPSNTSAHNNLGGALKRTGDLAGSIASYKKAVQASPDMADLHNNLGIVLTQNGDLSQAETCYKRALKLAPDNYKFITSLCDFYEKTNDLSGLSDVLSQSENTKSADNANVLYYAALLGFRQKTYDHAKAVLDRIDPDALIPKRVIAYYELKGKLYDKLGLFDEAFNAFTEMNAQAETSPEFATIKSEEYFAGISAALKDLTQAKPVSTDRNPAPDNTPCFLIGFPRSGTTLLDTILRSHSQIIVAEEQPMVAAMRHEMAGIGSLNEIDALSAKQQAFLQAQYFAELEKHIETSGANQLCIDKLPLNALDTPLINAVFPKAKYILAIRHPYDCILSCYMQYFKLNPQMANMVNLDRIVAFYCVVMHTWAAAQTRYGLDFHMIRYEDLVADMPTEVNNLLQFLGLEWEDSMANYQKTARARGKINTPSYSQVVQPLYKDASYRWKNYQKHFEPYHDQIQPWIERFGYA